jgi:aryl-alcohol dehydrogenase-like predicted oxidoreductase
METTLLGGQRVSRIGLGTWAIGGMEWGAVSESDAISTILSALDLGINFIDTAPIYGHGRSEELLGKAIRLHGRRDHFFLATKAGLDWGEDADSTDGNAQHRAAIVANLSPARLLTELERSLRRLGTDYIDLYQVHWPDPTIDPAETAEILLGFQRSGKVRALGVSNFTVAQMERFRAVAPLVSNQPPYNLFERAIDHQTLPWCAQHGVAVICYSSLCRSLLGGRLRPEMVFDDIRRVDPKFQPPRFAQYLAAVDRLDQYARERFGKSVAELAVRWVLDRPGISIALWGAKRPQQLETALGVMGWHLDAEAMAAIDAIVDECVTDPVGPEYLTPGTRDA